MAGTPLVLPVEFNAGAQVVQALTRELSLEGAFVRCHAPPAIGAQLALKLFLPGFETPEEIRAVVRERATSGEAGFWASFVSGPAQSRERVATLLAARAVDPALEPERGASSKPPATKAVLGLVGLRKSGPDIPLDAADFARLPRLATPATGVPSVPPAGGAADKVNGAAAAASPGAEGAAPAAGAAGPASSASAAGPASSASAAGPASSASAAEAAAGANRRVFPRYDVKFAVRFATVQDFVLEYAANISAGGVFVHTKSPPDMDSIVNVTMELPGGGSPVEAKALVVHRVTPEQAAARNTMPGVGVQFTELDDELRQRIDRAIAHILKDGAKHSM